MNQPSLSITANVGLALRADANAIERRPAPRAAYVHVPFCRHRCGYCNFTVLAGRDDRIAAYLQALERELSQLQRPQPVDTLFIGGGTPTHLVPTQLERLLALVTRWFPLAPGGEFSVEANPADVTPPRVACLAAAGVNRVSLGAQSFAADKLRSLERDHSAADIVAAVERLRPHVACVSLDLIFAAPGETLVNWQRDLAQTLALAPEHLSTYGLTYERGTRFFGRRIRRELTELDEELQRAMYLEGIERLSAAGYEHYEVSNFARPGWRCRHNEVYWQGAEYFAAGAGAARYVAGQREVNHKSTTTYIARVLAGRSPVAERETLSPEDRAREALVLGLRRLAGVDLSCFAERFGFTVAELGGPALERYVAEGWLIRESGWLRLSRSGLLISDALWPALLRN